MPLNNKIINRETTSINQEARKRMQYSHTQDIPFFSGSSNPSEEVADSVF